MKKILIALSLIPSLIFAQTRHEEIQSWVEVTPKKGYILSVDLHYEKMCSKIWTKQLKEFKKMNPHIPNPNLILVNQKIKVQDCRVVVKEATKPELEEVKKTPEVIHQKLQWFVGVFGGASTIGEKSDDTAKNGISFGAKVGTKTKLGDKDLTLALGYLQNNSKTNDDNNSLGVYEVKTELITIETALLSSFSEKFQLGPKIMLVGGRDTSMTEKQDGHTLGAYIGADALYSLKKDLKLEMNLQHRLDDLSRVHLLGNIGLRFDF